MSSASDCEGSLGINRRREIIVTPKFIERFNEKLTIGESGECWLWSAAVRNGYGAIKNDGHLVSAHRVAYVIANGEPPAGTIVQHECDSKLCCNPDHLIADTPARNNRDARTRIPFAVLRGDTAPHAVMTADDVLTIWRLRRERRWGATRIAKYLGVKMETVKSVLKGKNWKHLQPVA